MSIETKLNEYKNQVLEIYSKASDFFSEHTTKFTNNYPFLKKLDARAGVVGLTAISAIFAPVSTLAGVGLGYFGADQVKDTYFKVKQVFENSPLEVQILSVGLGVLALNGARSLLPTFSLGLTSGVIFADLVNTKA